MMCLFQFMNNNSKTNEEFRKVLEKRIRIFIALIIIGTITAILALLNQKYEFLGSDSWLNGLYSGMGSGIICVSVIKLRQARNILKEKSLLKEERLKVQDERNQMIASKAVQAAAATVLFLSYIAMLITSFYSRIIFYCFWSVAVVFCFSYFAFFTYYNKKC